MVQPQKPSAQPWKKSLRDKSPKISNSGLLEKLLAQSEKKKLDAAGEKVKAETGERKMPTAWKLK